MKSFLLNPALLPYYFNSIYGILLSNKNFKLHISIDPLIFVLKKKTRNSTDFIPNFFWKKYMMLEFLKVKIDFIK